MGHLYYDDLELSSRIIPTPEQLNATNFDNLIVGNYWSSTALDGYLDIAWYFDFYGGFHANAYEGNNLYGLAVRSGQVSAVPVPGAIWLFGSGLVGVVTLGRRRKGNRVWLFDYFNFGP